MYAGESPGGGGVSGSAGAQALGGLPELDNTAVCVQQHPAGFIGGKAAAFQHTGRVMGGGIGPGGADGLPHQGRLAYGSPCKGEQRVDVHGADSFLLLVKLFWQCQIGTQNGGLSAKLALEQRNDSENLGFKVPDWH